MEEGNIGPHSYQIEESWADVHMFGKGWHIQLDETPSAEPVIEVTDRRFKSNPIRDPEFVEEALRVAKAYAERVRAHMSTEWPRRTTKPDADGMALHPLGRGLSSKWFCLHCDGEFTGSDMARNLWHCPDCSATPIDIFDSPFWLEETAK